MGSERKFSGAIAVRGVRELVSCRVELYKAHVMSTLMSIRVNSLLALLLYTTVLYISSIPSHLRWSNFDSNMYAVRNVMLLASCIIIIIFVVLWPKARPIQRQATEEQAWPLGHQKQQRQHQGMLYERLSTVLKDWLVHHPSAPGVQCALSFPIGARSIETNTNIVLAVESQTFKSSHEAVRPLTTQTPWRIASITKTFVSVAVLKLYESASVELDAPAAQYLPEWASELLKGMTLEGKGSLREVSVRMLLQHTSGLYDHSVDPALDERLRREPDHRWTARELLNFAAEHGKPVAKPGERFSYSDTGYIFLGVLIEHVTDKGMAKAVRELAGMDRLQLSSTWWEIFEHSPGDISRKKANQYLGDTDVSEFDGSFDSFCGGGLVSNSVDLNKFTIALHKGGLLRQETMRLLYSTVPIPPDSYIAPESSEYGLGWIKSISHGHVVWWHLGFWGSWTGYVPLIDLAFSGTFNQGDNPFHLASLILQTVLGHVSDELQIVPTERKRLFFF